MAGALTDCLVAPAIRLHKGEGLAEGLRCLREFDPRVFLIFGGEAEDVQWLHETLEDQAGHPILFCADLERGAGEQFEGLTPLPDAYALNILGAEACYDAGHRTAAEAAKAGVRWILAPVLDLHRSGRDAVNSPIVGHRAFHGDPKHVVELAAAWLKGCADAGGISCGKHFPGHGACPQDSHTEKAVAAEDLGPHLEPFKALLKQLPTIMAGHIHCPMLDDDDLPASRSAKVLSILRKQWGYKGLVVSDSLRMTGYGDGPHEQLAMESLHAGVDLLLDPEDPVVLAISLRDALQRGDLDAGRVEEAAARVHQLQRRAGDLPVAQPKPLMLGAGSKRLLKPLPGGSPGKHLPQPELALWLSGTRDTARFLEDWGVQAMLSSAPPPAKLPEAVLVIWGASAGRGLPPLPHNWVEAITKQHTILYVAGSPEAAEMVPKSAKGVYLPGISPALLALLFAEEVEK
ncbi:MAG: hypothetical protein EYC70_08200 [Planctomycetota bacterium]|nr:MAG: hypothetical protein EYC70_08200 [Planctomycetota bacterium]